MTTRSIIYLINECLKDGADHVCSRRINQDPLESHFGHQRQRGRNCDASTEGFAYNVRAITLLDRQLQVRMFLLHEYCTKARQHQRRLT